MVGSRLSAQHVASAVLTAFVVLGISPLGWSAERLPATDTVNETLHGEGGILVHLGCGNPQRSLQLEGNGQFLVQALDRDAKKVIAARQTYRERDRYGPVSANVLNENSLPFADNLLNVLVVDESFGLSREEMLRVIRPLGTLWIADDSGEAWETVTKSWPESIDEWTHFLHDASGNAVSQDQNVGPPRRLQWTGGPLWTRSHEFNNSMPAMVTARGRMFYIFDYGLTGMEDSRLPEKWTLIARDAFNGRVLWKRDLSTWGSHQWTSRALRFFKGNMARRLVADGDRVYVTFDYGKGVEILDAATGSSLGQVPGTEGSEEILVDGNDLICVSQVDPRRPNAHVVITSYDIEGAQTKWQHKSDGHYIAQLPCIGQHSFVFHDTQQIVCLNIDDGSLRWKVDAGKSVGGKENMLLIADDKVVVASSAALKALSLRDGHTVWSVPAASKKGSMREYDLFVAQGKVFANSDGNLVAGYDLETGRKVVDIDPTAVQSQGHHLRCYRAKATENFLITQFRGVEFLSLNKEIPHNQNDWLRGSCTYGVMPANGFLYQPPHSCFCYAAAMQKGFNAFSSPSLNAEEHESITDRPGEVEPGEAYGYIGESHDDSGDWAMYRRDARRTGSTLDSVSGDLQRKWKLDFGTPVTPPVASNGRVYVAAKSQHSIYALDAATGQRQWSFIAGGPIDSAPTIHRNLVVFGCSDGYAYCVRASDGALAWRRRLAPQERWLADNGQLESVWRLHGSVPIHGELAYFIAGRSSFLDGGLFLSAVDIQSGKIVHRANLYTGSNEREDRKRNEFVESYHIEGAHSDLLVVQGDHIYLNQMKFSPELKLQPAPYLSKEQITSRPSMNLDDKDFVNDAIFKVKWRNTTYDTYDKLAGILVDEEHGVGERDLGLHMFTTSGFLDTSFFNRTYWMYSKTWPGFNHTNLAPKSGQLLVVGPRKTYALKAFTERYALSPSYTPETSGYLIVADDNNNEPTLDPRAWGKDKGMGFSRGAPPIWHHWVPVRVKAMVLGGDDLYLCGAPDILKKDDPLAAFEGRLGSELWTLSADDGTLTSQATLEETPIFDGLIVAQHRLYMCTEAGELICWGGQD